MSTLKSVAWSLLLAVLCIPALVVSVVMLPWIPLVARGAEWLGRIGARWLGEPIAPRKSGRWFDWQQFYHLILQLLISCVACLVWFMLGFTVGVLVVASFVADSLELGSVHLTQRAAVFAASWGLALVGLALLVGLGKLLAFVSVATSRLALSPSAQESRAVLIDAFSGERRRIERELHDGPQQYLTALKLNLAAARLGDATGVAAALDAADHNATLALAALRYTVRGIAPQVLFDRGLVAAVEELLAHSGLETSLDVHGQELGLDEMPALLAYHCVAEGLTNAVKHGGACSAKVTLDFRKGLVVRVLDDGRGLSPGGGTGVAGLRERAAALGGNVELLDAECGAELRMELP